MYGLTRGTVTLICAAVAGFLIWPATQVNEDTNGGYWGVFGLITGAGLVMAFSQLVFALAGNQRRSARRG